MFGTFGQVARVFLYKGEQAVSATDRGLGFWLWETRALTSGCRMILVGYYAN